LVDSCEPQLGTLPLSVISSVMGAPRLALQQRRWSLLNY
jgi:hypothetical protein